MDGGKSLIILNLLNKHLHVRTYSHLTFLDGGKSLIILIYVHIVLDRSSEEITIQIKGYVHLLLIDCLCSFMPTKKHNQMKKVNKEISDSIMEFINKRMKAGESNSNSSTRDEYITGMQFD